VFAMPGRTSNGVRLIMLSLTFGLAMSGGLRPGEWSGNYSPCDRHREVLKHEHMSLGVRFAASNPWLVNAFVYAMDFWATVLDMDWYEEDSRACSIQIVDGNQDLFGPAEVARAQFPRRLFLYLFAASQKDDYSVTRLNRFVEGLTGA